METIPVTLIVKAPNQQIEDQTIQCELSWTINKLKQHLSEVYPSKPPKHEQKLIYSGQLLPDTVVLKDVLRQYEGQETHTVHLVCSTRHHISHSIPSTSKSTNMTNNAATVTRENASTEANMPPRQDNTNAQWVNLNGMDPNQYAAQVAWMQQAYMQYMTQYMHVVRNNYTTIPNAEPATQGEAAEVQDAPQAVQQPQQQQPQQRDPENPERDWLDAFYTLSRLMVLLSVVYFYSSPLRFVFVMLLGFGFYLYQIGFFRNLNNNNNNNNNNTATEQENPQVQTPSVFMVVWTFFTTFFASLIPEIPQAV